MIDIDRKSPRAASLGCRLLLLAACVGGATALSISEAGACSTPVYRVAMYDWVSAPYHVFYFYRDKVADEDSKVHEKITEAAKDETPANIVLHLVDVADEKALEQLPEVVVESWKKELKQEQPLHAVYSAWGAKIWSGRLTVDEVGKLIDSPKRQELAKLLDAGNAAVMLVLAAPNEEKTKKAEKIVGEVIADAASGKIDAGALPAGPAPAAGDDDDGETEDEDAPKLKVATLTLSRTDAAEQWFVRSLLAIEPDLSDFGDEAMIFAVYGRARALPPFIGKGISLENLTDAVFFVSGACSCTIKDQNPGMDLLVCWDWDQTAETLAASDPSLEWQGDEMGYMEVEPEPVAEEPEPAEPTGDTPEDLPPTESASSSSSEPAETDDPAEKAPSGATPKGSPEGQPASEVGAAPVEPAEAVGQDDAAGHSEEGEYAARQTLHLTIGLGLGAVVLLALGMVLMRRQ